MCGYWGHGEGSWGFLLNVAALNLCLHTKCFPFAADVLFLWCLGKLQGYSPNPASNPHNNLMKHILLPLMFYKLRGSERLGAPSFEATELGLLLCSSPPVSGCGHCRGQPSLKLPLGPGQSLSLEPCHLPFPFSLPPLPSSCVLLPHFKTFKSWARAGEQSDKQSLLVWESQCLPINKDIWKQKALTYKTEWWIQRVGRLSVSGGDVWKLNQSGYLQEVDGTLRRRVKEN